MSGIEIGKQHFLIEKREEGEFMKIGLLGFEFDSPNKGCEALGYSFVSLIKKNYPDKVEFYVFTNDELGLFPEYFDDICFEKVPLKIKDFSFQMIKAMRKCDFIFDVTLGDSFSDIYSIDQCLSNIRFKFLAEIFGRKYILLPQTYGPFEDKKCRDRSIHILNHADYIFCRDKKSMEYIRALGIKSTHLQLTTDMAFALPYNEEKYTIDSNNIKIGINVSGLLWKGGFERKNQFGLSFDYRQFIYDILTYFTDKVNAEVYLIPHVIDNAESARDDDYRYLKTISENNTFVKIAPAFSSPIDAKSFISKMDFFIGSRMHATIASFSSGVPTVAVSYSRKFEGLFGSMNYPYVVHGNEETIEEAENHIINWFNQRDIIKKQLLKSNSIIENSLLFFETELTKILTAVRNDGQEYSMDYNTAWMSILGRVIRRSCKFCVDSIGEAADISCGDYWKLDENNNPSFEEADGVNCIFTWTNKGNELLNLIAKEKNICIQKENIDKLKYAQPNHFNRRCTILYKTIAMRMFFRKSPKYAFSKMFLLAKYKSLRDGFRIFKGTVKRILQGRI